MMTNNFDKLSKEYYDYLEENVYSSVISDALDSLGYRNQTTDPDLRPLDSKKVLVGRAKTAQVTEINREPKKPYVKLIDLLDSVGQGDVIIASLGGSNRSGFFGELLGTVTSAAGGRGAIVDGMIRDAKQLKNMGFPVFTKGFKPTDSFGRNDVVDNDVIIDCGGVTVSPGDLVIGDVDGVVIVPKDLEDQVVQKAFNKVNGEDNMREELKKGMKISEAFKKYGIL